MCKYVQMMQLPETIWPKYLCLERKLNYGSKSRATRRNGRNAVKHATVKVGAPQSKSEYKLVIWREQNYQHFGHPMKYSLREI
jgi:hypothetical protein